MTSLAVSVLLVVTTIIAYNRIWDSSPLTLKRNGTNADEVLYGALDRHTCEGALEQLVLKTQPGMPSEAIKEQSPWSS